MFEPWDRPFEPLDFVGVPYDGLHYPGRWPIEDFKSGCNCQLLALGVLSSAGFDVCTFSPSGEPMRSQEICYDREFTRGIPEAVDDASKLRKFDILLFLPSHAKAWDLKKLHVGVYVGVVEGYDSPHCVLHNAYPGPSSIWALSDFEKSPQGYHLFFVKRPVRPARLPQPR